MKKEDVDVDALQGFYKQVNDLIGTDAMLALWEEYRGTQLTIPIHLYSRDYARTRINEQYDGTNTRQLARKYQYSEKWVRQVINQKEADH